MRDRSDGSGAALQLEERLERLPPLTIDVSYLIAEILIDRTCQPRRRVSRSAGRSARPLRFDEQ